MTYVILHPQYDSYLEINSLLEVIMLLRPDPDKGPFSLRVAHNYKIFVFQMRLCHLGWARDISLKAKAE